MSSILTGNEQIQITGHPTQVITTVKEISEFSGGADAGVTEEFVKSEVTKGVAPKADKTYVDAEFKKKADKTYVDTELGKKVDKNTFTQNIDQINTAAGKTAEAVNKANADILSHDAVLESLSEGKLDIAALHDQYCNQLPIQHVSEPVDLFKLPYGIHTIHTNNAQNAPPDTRVLYTMILRTHDEEPSDFPFVDIPDTEWEQGTTQAGGQAGNTRDELINPANPLNPSRVRTKVLVPVEEFGNVKLTGVGYLMYISWFGEDKKTLGIETQWSESARIAPRGAKYFQPVIRNTSGTPITPAEVQGKFIVGVSNPDLMKGEGKLIIAWGAMVGDLHTCVGIEGVMGDWHKIGTQLPQEAPEGSLLMFKGDKWVAVKPEEVMSKKLEQLELDIMGLQSRKLEYPNGNPVEGSTIVIQSGKPVWKDPTPAQ